ncbi:MAG: hypothetical protein KGJ62_12735 [Armatimonadetes bacterium]|nr:hypothetical protein [Armatimonadota bacterium]MDE2207886.1 hypothetical protein [Armatimonadota bacterium]
MAHPLPEAQSQTELGHEPIGGAQPDYRHVTARSILLGMVLIVPNALWLTTVEVRWYTLDGSCLPLFIEPVFWLFCLTVVNALVRRALPARWKEKALTPYELLTVYIILVIGTLLGAHDLFQDLFGTIGHPYQFATPENRWKDLFFPFLPKFWLVTDKTALKGFYNGSVSAYQPQYFVPFLRPLFWWAIFILTIIGICLCFNILIRTQWSESERLAFPIIELPLALTGAGGAMARSGARPLLQNRLMWLGFSLAATVDLINGLHVLHPSFPYLALIKQYNIGNFFTTRPWSVISGTNMSLYPFAIGLAFFVPLDLSFSCWFFFIWRKLFHVFGAELGWDGPASNGFPYFDQQASGAWIAWGVTLVWALRAQFKRTFQVAFAQPDGPAVRGAPICDQRNRNQYRAAWYGILVGVAVLWYFSWRMGLSLWVAVLFFGLYFLIALTIARARAELGTPHEIYFVNPRTILVTIFGSATIGPQGLTALSTMYWFNRCYRCHPMPNQLEAMKMGDVSRMRQTSVLWVLVVAFLWGTLAAFWANMHVTFAAGASAKAIGFKGFVGGESYNPLAGWLQTPVRPQFIQLVYMAGGFLMVLFLSVMHSSFLWWPFHPAGYALAVSFAMDYFWMCFFVAWLAKWLIVRFGGMRSYNAAVPFFLGLILGDYVVGAAWAIYGPLAHIQVYKIFI